MAEPKISTFAKLNSLNVDSLTEEKNKLTYLNWAHAVRALQDNFPTATWEVKRFDGLPFLKTEVGYFVEVELTIKGRTLSQLHPVFDFRGKTILKPTAMDINNSTQRCLAKVIALHGLGLYIYARDEAPEQEAEAEVEVKSRANQILSGILNNTKMITQEQQKTIKSIVITADFTDDRMQRALDYYGVKGFGEMTWHQADSFINKFD